MPAFTAYASTLDVSNNEAKMKDDLRYNSLRNLDDHSDSSTEVGEWDVQVDPRPTRRKAFWRRASAWRWLLETSLLLIIVGLLVEKRWKHHAGSHAFEHTGDITGFAPSFSQHIVTFTPDPIYAPENASEFFSPETKQAWLDMVPGKHNIHSLSFGFCLRHAEGLGYVNVTNPSQYNNLPKPIHDYPSSHVYTTSMTHQLHCLYTILEAYNTLQLPISARQPIKMPWHINHCFEYIRQAMMCAGDVALEGAATTFPAGEGGEDRGGSDGWDAKHVCKDYGQVKDYLEDRTMNHWKWISSE